VCRNVCHIPSSLQRRIICGNLGCKSDSPPYIKYTFQKCL